MQQGTVTQNPDWGATPYRVTSGGRFTETIAAIVLIGLVAVISILLGPHVGPLGIGIFVAVVAVMVFGWVTNQGLFALRSAGARKLQPDEQPRLTNIASGLATDLRAAVPSLFVIDRGGPNAFACKARGPAIAVSASLLDGYTRTELEAVIAHCLCRLATKEVDNASYGIALGPFGRGLVPRVGYADDVRAASLTRFPPALASAIEKADPARGRSSALWFVGAGHVHRAPDERATAIRDL
jgi:hypothetical protein